VGDEKFVALECSTLILPASTETYFRYAATLPRRLGSL